MKQRACIALAAAILVIVASSCASGPTFSREEVLISLADNLMVPTFMRVATDMSTLRSSVHSLCSNPTATTLQEVKDTWRDAKQSWMRSRAIGFGPVMDRRSRSFVDWWPVEPQRIENTLQSQDTITSNYVREFMSATQRGLGAMEYLIFDDKAYMALAAPDQLRCEYLTATADVAAEEMDGVLTDWVGAGGPKDGYYGEFTGQASSALLPLAAVSETVRTTIFLLRSITDMQLGAALGMNDSESDPEALRSGPGLSGVSDLREQIIGMWEAYAGAGAPNDDPENAPLGIGVLVAGVSMEADERVAVSFENAIAAIGTLEEPLHDSLFTNRAEAVEVYETLKELQRTLNTEVVSLLGITVGFADTDGDGG